MRKDFTIKEISEITGKSKATIYRYVKDEKLPTFSIFLNGQNILKATSKDIERVFGIKINGKRNGGNGNEKSSENVRETPFSNEKALSQIVRENVDIAVQNALSQRESQLLKPLEDQAMYIAGKLQSENQFLKERLETIIAENQELREAMKALPMHVEEITEKLEQTEKEKSDLASSLEISRKEKEEMSQALQMTQREKEELRTRTESVMKAKDRVLADRENTVQTLKQQAEELEKEKERLMTDMTQQTEELLSQKEKEMAELQEKLKEQFEKQTEEIAAAWRRELEAERSRPWWKRIFGG